MHALKEGERYMVSISGIPGSGMFLFPQSYFSGINIPGGKTTLAQIITDRMNAADYSSGLSCERTAVCLSMDGYHMTRAELSEMPNAAEAHERRGAPWTFNVHALHDMLNQVRNSTQNVYAASFDHAVKDPVENDIVILPENRLVVVEGLYLSLDQDGWRDISDIFDESWFVEVGRNVAVDRVIERHLKSGIVDTREQADERARGSDYLNADLILAHRLPVDEVIESLEEAGWTGAPVDEVLE